MSHGSGGHTGQGALQRPQGDPFPPSMSHTFGFVGSFSQSFIHSQWNGEIPLTPVDSSRGSCGPAPLLELSSRPLEHQRPGSPVTSVLSWAWFPGIPGVAGSFGGYSGNATRVILLPPMGTFPQTRPRWG